MIINTLANWITLIRFGLYLLVLAIIFAGPSFLKIWTLPIYILVFAMDGLDGWAARKYKQTSEVGIAFDRASDRIIVTTLALSYIYFVPDMLVFIILLTNLARDFLVSGLRQLAAETKIKMGKHVMGKFKFVLENLSAILMVIILTVPTLFGLTGLIQQVILVILLLSSVLGWWSFALYFRQVLFSRD